MIKNVYLKHVELCSESVNGVVKYFLKAVYPYENEEGIYDLIIPKIYLPIVTDRLPSIHLEPKTLAYSSSVTDCHCNLGFGDCDLGLDEDGRVYYTELIKQKPRKMTLKDIEKELGYKIELINKKEKEQK